MDCCCGGSEKKVADNMNGEEGAGDDEELVFTVASMNPCRDLVFPHPTTKACQLLSHLPSSLPMDSG